MKKVEDPIIPSAQSVNNLYLAPALVLSGQMLLNVIRLFFNTSSLSKNEIINSILKVAEHSFQVPMRNSP